VPCCTKKYCMLSYDKTDLSSAWQRICLATAPRRPAAHRACESSAGVVLHGVQSQSLRSAGCARRRAADPRPAQRRGQLQRGGCVVDLLLWLFNSSDPTTSPSLSTEVHGTHVRGGGNLQLLLPSSYDSSQAGSAVSVTLSCVSAECAASASNGFLLSPLDASGAPAGTLTALSPGTC